LGTDALNLFENDILHESPEAYKAKVKAILQAPIEVQEEERFIRGNAFKRAIPRIYQSTCAITGLGIDGAINASMVDACHIVPFSSSQNDTIGNGIALCPNMHRAFDRGLISISDNYQVLVSDQFIERDSSYGLRQFQGKQIWLPEISEYQPSVENLAWHRERFGFV
jgi:putative restriction endonuclease